MDKSSQTDLIHGSKQSFTVVPLTAQYTFTALWKISSEHPLPVSCIATETCASAMSYMKWATALCFWVTWPCLLNSLHHSADIWRTGWQISECVCEEAEYPAITGSSEDKACSCRLCVSVQVHRDQATLSSTDSLENPPPLPQSIPLSIPHIFALSLHHFGLITVAQRSIF